MSRRRRTAVLPRSLSAAIAVLALLAVAAGAQDDEPADIFLDTVEVDVVNLEVVVTDRDGNAVQGLTREDFVVLEDGERVELTNFYAVQGGARRDAAAADEPALPLGEEPEPEPLPAEQQLSLAVVIDNANIDPASRKRVLDQLREHLAEVLRPGDRVLVATLEPQAVVHQGFTDDPAAIDAALDAIGRSAGGRPDLFAQRRMIRSSIANLDGSGGGGGGAGMGPESPDTPEDGAERVLALIGSYAGQAESLMRQTFGSLETLTASLAGLPGRRAVLLVSEHLATNPAEGLLQEWYDNFSSLVPGLPDPVNEARRWNVNDEMRRVAHSAASDRVTFYTLHASGVLGSMPGAGDGALLGAPGAGGDLGQYEPLMHLAAATGGSSVLSNVNVAALVDRMSDDYRDYYSLGYTSDKSHDGRYHHIEIRVPGRRDLRVRHTEGYRAKTAEERMKERTLSALMFDLAENPLDVRVQLMPEQEQGRNLVLPVLVRVPISQLVLVPQGSSHVARVSIVVALRDDQGRLSEPQRVEVPITIPNEKLLEAMGQEIGHGINLLVRKGDAKLAVGVRDELSAVESTLNLNVTVGKG